MRSVSRSLSVAGALLVVVGLAAPSLASDPASHDVTVPTTAGQVVEVEWTGLIPPGANQTSDCSTLPPVADHHTIELAVPAGTYDQVRVTAEFLLEYEGPAVDAILTVVDPEGNATSADGGFVDTDESLGLAAPAAGTYDVQACAFAAVNPQPYTGRLRLEAKEILPVLAEGEPCVSPSRSLKFEERYIDETRAGGEPIVTTHPDGTLLWGSHAGTTHFFTPGAPDPQTAAFLQNYQGQTYQYFSADGGATWEFVPRLPFSPDNFGVPNSGFSDPEFAIDAAGNVFISEINLANVAVSKSSDAGRTYTLQNITGFTMTDRQWTSADEEDVLYMTGNAILGGTFPGAPLGTSGHVLAKSTDGGATFTQPEVANPDGVADTQVNPVTGDLYELTVTGAGLLAMGVYRGIRGVDEGPFADLLEINEIADGAGLSGIGRLIDPTFDMDAQGNLYFVWTENGNGVREPGIYYSFSTDDARTWAAPVRVDPDENADAWPWLAVGDQGQVAIVWLQTDVPLENNNAELAGPENGWHVNIAYTANGLGCGESQIPGFRVQQTTQEPVHFGTICQGGTACQAELVDRRLGDYFANEVDLDGNVYISVSNTIQGGAVALPYLVLQVGGPSFRGGPEPPSTTTPPGGAPAPAPQASPSAAPAPSGALPATGGGLVALGVGLLGLGVIGAAARRGRRRL